VRLQEGEERDVVTGPGAAQVHAEGTRDRPLATELHRVGSVGEEAEPVALAQRRLRRQRAGPRELVGVTPRGHLAGLDVRLIERIAVGPSPPPAPAVATCQRKTSPPSSLGSASVMRTTGMPAASSAATAAS